MRSKKVRDSDYLEHIGYAEIEPDRIWDIVKSHVPSLQVAVGRLRRLVTEQQAQSEEETDRREDRGR